MANYIASSRSNYFKVKDAEKFKAWVSSVPGLGWWDGKEDTYAVYSDDADGGGWPSCRNVDDDYIEFDFLQELSEHLQDDQVAVLQEVGYEKLRYLVGYAQAVNAKGNVVTVSINDIYQAATEAFGVEDISMAEY